MTEPDASSPAPESSPLPEGGWHVRLLDLSGGAEDGFLEDVGPFPSQMHANEFARRYVRDSLERCRQAGAKGAALIESWSAFGEDAVVLPEQPENWRSRDELEKFAAKQATASDRDWRALDPRKTRGVAAPSQGHA